MGDALVRGVVGVVKWSYYNAAGVEGYTLRRHKETNTWSLSARVVVSDSFKLRQRPLVFEAPHQGGLWRWPMTEWSIAEGVLTARLGPLEEVPACRVSSGLTFVR